MRIKMFKIIIISSILICIVSLLNVQAKTSYDGTNNDFEYTINDYGDNYKVITLTKYIGNDATVFVPEKIDGYQVTYTEQTFKNNTHVQRIEFSNGITAIGPETFYGCSNLKEVILPETVKTLNEYAFAYSEIEKLILPKETHYIGEGCFYGCKKLSFLKSNAENIPFFNYSISLGEYAFFDTGFITIQISSEGYLNFYDNTFNNDYKITKSTFFAFLYQNEFTRMIVEFILSCSYFEMAVCILILFLLIISVIYLISSVIRLIMRMFGGDIHLKYKKYESVFISQLPNRTPNYIVYRKVISFADIAIKVLKVLTCVLLLISWLALFLLINSYIHFSLNATLFSSILKTGLVMTGYILFTFLLVFAIYKVAKKLNKKKKKNKNFRTHLNVRKVRLHYNDK